LNWINAITTHQGKESGLVDPQNLLQIFSPHLLSQVFFDQILDLIIGKLLMNLSQNISLLFEAYVTGCSLLILKSHKNGSLLILN
jgi:hypothetical protein